jgi:predicted Holliday junction resolvase-like endonuclease
VVANTSKETRIVFYGIIDTNYYVKEMTSRIALIDYLKLQQQIYCECPLCGELFRLNEAKLTFGKKARKDLLDKLRETREEFELRLGEEREDAKKRSRATSKGLMLENICPYLPNFRHHPRDARFLGDPIDFVIFDGLFPSKNVKELTIMEVKTGKPDMSDAQSSIKKAVEKGRVNFELIQLR